MSLTSLKWSRSRQNTRELIAALGQLQRPSSCSRNSVRFGRLVSASWRAMCEICACARCHSVMSSKVDTQPPPFIG